MKQKQKYDSKKQNQNIQNPGGRRITFVYQFVTLICKSIDNVIQIDMKIVLLMCAVDFSHFKWILSFFC